MNTTPFELSPHLVAGVFMVAVGLSAAVLAKYRWGIQWRWLLIGGAVWFFAALEKWQIDAWLHQPVLGGLQDHASRLNYLLLGSTYIGLLTGVTEVAVMLVAGLIWRELARDARRAIGIGLGAGVFEAMLFGFQEMGHRENLATVSTATVIFSPSVERILVIVCHTVVRAMVLFAVATRRWSWFWMAFFFFSLLDGLCGFYILTDVYPAQVWWIELSYAVFAITAFPILKYLIRNWPASKPCPGN